MKNGNCLKSQVSEICIKWLVGKFHLTSGYFGVEKFMVEMFMVEMFMVEMFMVEILRVERFVVENFMLKYPRLKDLWLKSLGLKNSWWKSPGLKLCVEKSGDEMSFNQKNIVGRILKDGSKLE